MEALHCRWSTAFFRGDIERALAESLGNSKWPHLGCMNAIASYQIRGIVPSFPDWRSMMFRSRVANGGIVPQSNQLN